MPISRYLNNERRLRFVVLLIPVLCIASLSVGLLYGFFRWWPVSEVMAAYRIHSTDWSIYDRMPNTPLSQEAVKDLITIHNLEDVVERRARVIELIWKTRTLPEEAAERSADIPIPAQFADTPNLARIESLRVNLPLGFVSEAWHFVPKDANGVVVIYHEGHDGGFEVLGADMIKALLAQKYAVVGMSMPMSGRNRHPAYITTQRFGPIRIRSHENLSLLETEAFSPLVLFLDPPVKIVNWIKREGLYRKIAMMGISGGGWTTTLIAALDPRIDASYPVAGSLPFYLRSVLNANSWGDYEQHFLPLYQIATYEELYVMASVGAGRRQIQLFNAYDDCCFMTIAAEHYGPTVTKLAAEMGGAFDVFIYRSSYQHAVSPVARAEIIQDLGVTMRVAP